jgi:hypothetical protein
MAILNDVLNCLEAMDIAGASPGAVLGDGLGMDSQELTCAAARLQKKFGVRVEMSELSRKMCVLDLAALLARKVAMRKQVVALDYGLAEDVVIESTCEQVYRALFDFESWPRKLPHVRGVLKRYDDGVFQEFDMDVKGANRSVLPVRSVRRCEPGTIQFFQPVPPKFMRHHCGGWILHPLTDRLTHVLTWHQWRLSDAAGEAFPEQPGNSVAEQIQRWVADHARYALRCWKSCLEEDGVEKNGRS